METVNIKEEARRLINQILVYHQELTISVGWVEERNPTFTSVSLGFAIAQPNLRL